MSNWKPESHGSVRAARLFVDVGGERLKLLAYTYDRGASGPASGFAIFARDSGGQYLRQVAVGKATNFGEAKTLAEAAVRQPRSQWPVHKPG